MRFETARYSDTGGRPENEDATLCATSANRRLMLTAVADGLGGHGGGAIASSTAAQCLGESMDRLLAPSEEAIREVCVRMNDEVLAAQTSGCHMKTTLAMALLYWNGTTAFAHIGDSRIYHFRGGRILYQSLDHSVSQLAVLAGEITQDQIRFHEDRNRVLRVLGSEDTPKPDIRITEQNLQDGDALLLCTDGFWEYVLEEEMLDTLARAGSAKDWLGRMVKVLRSRVKEGNDNNSAVAVRVHDGFGRIQRRRS